MVLKNVTGNTDFNNVNFKYPSHPDVHIFNYLTLHIPSGKVQLNLLYVTPFVHFAAVRLPQITVSNVYSSVALTVCYFMSNLISCKHWNSMMQPFSFLLYRQ
jgi:hypothetical protein